MLTALVETDTMTRALVRTCCALALLALPLGACGGLADQLQADDFAVGALIKTPDLTNPQDSSKTIPGVTSFQLFFGKIDRSKISLGAGGKQVAAEGAFTGVAGAIVKLDFHDPTNGDVEINVPDKGSGQYQIDSQTAERLTYDQTAYTATIAYSGQTFTLHVTAPAPTDIKELQAAPDRTITQTANTPLTITRTDAAGPGKNPIAFVNLSSVTGTAKVDAWNNVPKDPFGFLQLVLDDSAWRADSFVIPGDQFQPNSGYVVTLAEMAQGSADTATGSTALFVGSTLLAGVAAGGGVTTK